MQFNRQWKEFLMEERYPDLLLEARVKDVKAKYPAADKMGWINWGRRQIENALGTKGVSKYLMWYARELHRKYSEDFEEYLEYPGAFELNQDNILRFSEELMDIVQLFQWHQHKFEEKDIYKYHDEELKRMLDKLGVTTSAKAQKAAAEKKHAEENSEVVYSDHGIFAVRPLTTEASCYYGQNPRLTSWCISTKEKRNYFVQYTEEEGKVFVITKFSGIPEGSDNHLITLQFDHEGDLTMLWDAPNEAQDADDLWSIIREHLDGMPEYKNEDEDDLEDLISQIFEDITREAREWIIDNPPPNPAEVAERACEVIKNEANSDLEHISVYYDIGDNEYDHGVEVYYGAAVEFSIDTTGEEYRKAEKDLEDIDYSDVRTLERMIEDRMSESGIYGYEELDIDADGEDMHVQLRMAPEEAMNVEGFREFCAFTASAADKEIDDIIEIIKAVLAQEGYAAPSGQQLQLPGIEEDIQKYFSHNHLTKQSFYDSIEKDIIKEEKGRSRQRGIYKFYCMLTYGLTLEENKSRGLDDILADLRALPNVTIVTVVVKNQKVTEGRYIAGLSVKFIPSVPGQFNAPEDVKVKILRDIKRLGNVQNIFKVSAGLERLE